MAGIVGFQGLHLRNDLQYHIRSVQITNSGATSTILAQQLKEPLYVIMPFYATERI